MVRLLFTEHRKTFKLIGLLTMAFVLNLNYCRISNNRADEAGNNYRELGGTPDNSATAASRWSAGPARRSPAKTL